MFEEEQKFKIFKITLKEVMSRLATVENCDVDDFKDTVIEQFDDYNYEGEEDIKGISKWCDISNDGKYELTVGINHEDAYEFTLFVNVNDKKASIYNVL